MLSPPGAQGSGWQLSLALREVHLGKGAKARTSCEWGHVELGDQPEAWRRQAVCLAAWTGAPRGRGHPGRGHRSDTRVTVSSEAPGRTLEPECWR